MFSSNQELIITGDIQDTCCELEEALRFALSKSDWLATFTRKDNPAKCVWQKTEAGVYALGWVFGDVSEGWHEYPCDFDIEIIAQIIAQQLRKVEIKYGGGDGSYTRGFLLQNVEETFAQEYEGIKKPSHAIIMIKPFTCFYLK